MLDDVAAAVCAPATTSWDLIQLLDVDMDEFTGP